MNDPDFIGYVAIADFHDGVVLVGQLSPVLK
jgi:hypothetical protein